MKIEWKNLLPTLITAVVTICVAIAGWLFVDWSSSQRDQNNKRRDLQVQHLLEAYQNLTETACYQKLEEEEKNLRFVNKAASNIQLFGTDEQIKMVHTIINDYAEGKEARLNELVLNLRSELRTELDLPASDQEIRWIKADKKK